jgi:hypothetical protein
MLPGGSEAALAGDVLATGFLRTDQAVQATLALSFILIPCAKLRPRICRRCPLAFEQPRPKEGFSRKEVLVSLRKRRPL